MSIGKVIREKRREKNLSQEELANKIGVTKNNVWAWENEKYKPGIQSLQAIMSVLDIEYSEIFQPKEVPQNV